MTEQLRVLIVEDSEPDGALLLRELRKGGFSPVHKRVQSAEEMSDALDSESWDIVLCDYVMPGFSGLAALELLRRKGLDLPFVIVSGQIGEDVAVEAMKAGAHDYIMKGNLKRLCPAIERELAEAENRRQRRKAEEEVKKTAAELRVLARRLLEVQEEERHSIARELHDQTGQQLAVLKLLLEKMERSWGKSAPPQLVEAKQILVEIFSQVRNISLSLRPAMLDDFGLLSTLQWYFEDFARKTGVQVDFKYSGLERELMPAQVQTAAYRIIQEALTNVVRHAKTDRAAVLARTRNGKLTLQVKDNGVGFEPAQVSFSSSGLKGIRERAQYLDGKLSVESIPGKGTSLKVELPLEEQDVKSNPS